MTGTAWVTGSCDGSLSLWTQLKKKPAYTVVNAHPLPLDQAQAEEAKPGADPRSWVQSVAVCPGSDLVVRTKLIARCKGIGQDIQVTAGCWDPGIMCAVRDSML